MGEMCSHAMKRKGVVFSMIVINIGKGIVNPSSIPSQGCSHFTLC